MGLELCEQDFTQFLKALAFAAQQHKDERRKGGAHPPYINHPIDVTKILWDAGGVRDITTLVAALLHDTVEDTGTKPEVVEDEFGPEVRKLVMEVTDDKSLPKAERKRLQVVHAPHASLKARQIKLGDKISNVYEIAHDPPSDWSIERRREYLDWTEQVINGLRGENARLEARYDAVLAEARQMLAQES